MNKKVLTTSLLVTALGLPSAMAADGDASSPCADGGFYVGLNGGMAIGKTDIKSGGWKNKGPKKYANTKKTKGLPSFEFLIGGDMRTGDVRFGADLGIGTRFGKTKIRYEGCECSKVIPISETNKITVKTLWYAFIRPKIGYHFTPEIVGSLVLGLEASQTKISATSIETGVVSEKFKSAKKVKWNPTTGAELVWNVTDSIYTKLGYQWHIKKSQKVPKKLGAQFSDQPKLRRDGCPLIQGNVKSLKTQYHSVMVGVGYRF